MKRGYITSLIWLIGALIWLYNMCFLGFNIMKLVCFIVFSLCSVLAFLQGYGRGANR